VVKGIKSQAVAEYQKRPAFWQIDTSRLWEEYEAQRNLRDALREAKYQRLALAKAQQVESAKAAARAKRAVIKMTMKGVARRIAYAAVQTELRQTLLSIKTGYTQAAERARGGDQAVELGRLADWLQQQVANGREDALRALRAAAAGRDRDKAKALTADNNTPAPALRAAKTSFKRPKVFGAAGSPPGF
jgi:hypothetical protein